MRRTATGAAIVAGTALLFWLDAKVAGGWVVWCTCALLFAGAALEAGELGARMGSRCTAALLVAGAACLVLAFLDQRELLGESRRWDIELWYAAAAASGLVLGRAHRTALTLSVWFAPPFAALARLASDFGSGALVALVLLSKIGDVAGYYFGRRFGKRHPFPRLSPGKTVEGCAASLAAGLALGALLGARGWLLHPDLGWAGGLVAGGALNIAAQAGDLLESSFKRRAGVKDSGTWMGASGGLLDVLDSVLVTAPLAFLLGHDLFQAAH